MGRSKNKKNTRRRGNRKFVSEGSSSSSENEIQGDAPEESASSAKTTERGKIKGDVPEESSSSSKKTGRGKVKGEHIQAVQSTGGLDEGKDELQHLPPVKATKSLEERITEFKHIQAVNAAEALEKRITERPTGDDFKCALEQTRKNVINLRQESYEDIPVFPYAYADRKTSPTDNKRAPPLWVTEIHDDDYIRDNLSLDWLSSSPTLEQIDNLYGQLNQHAFYVCSHTMVSSRVVKVAPKDVPKGIEEIVLKGTPITSACDELIKEIYHIIRIKDTREGYEGFLDFLRANSNGYIGAFRWLKDLSQAKTVWCYFWDETRIIYILKFLKFVPTNYRSAYTYVENAKFGIETLEFGIDALKHVYFNPDGEKSKGAEIFFQIYLSFLGEGPRSNIVKRIIKRCISSQSHEHSPQLGVMIQGVITNWGFLSKTACFLRLMILELALAKNLIEEKPDPKDPLKPHPSLQKLFSQFAYNCRVAQCRCDRVVGHVKNIDREYDLIKQELNGKLMYGSVAYDKIVDDCLSLILHDEKLVCAIIMREKGSDELVCLKDEESVEEDKFWKKFAEVKEAYRKEHKDYILLRFLSDCVPVLQRWKYTRFVIDHIGYDEMNTWCARYLAYTHCMSEAEAGVAVVKEWNKEHRNVRVKLKDIVMFLEKNLLVSERSNG